MKQYTQEEFDNFEINGYGYKVCPSGDYSLIKIFGEDCSFGEYCNFGGYCSFGECCNFGGYCKCEGNHKFVKLFTIGYIGSRNGQTYFWLLTDGSILVRCGCFCGHIDDFEKAVEETHAGTKHYETYMMAIKLAKLQLGGQVR